MTAPPTLTGYTGIITDQPTITWTPDSLYEAAITEIRIGNDKALEYVVDSGAVAIDRDAFRIVDTYTATIKATGYTDASATIVLDLANWTRFVLFDVDDLIREEPIFLQEDDSTTLARYHDLVLDDLGTDLENAFTRNNEHLKDYNDSSYSILNYIQNPKQLKRPAMYRALWNIFEDRIKFEDDQYQAKANAYKERYMKYLRMFPKHIEFSDVDQNNIIMPNGYARILFPSNDAGKMRFTT